MSTHARDDQAGLLVNAVSDHLPGSMACARVARRPRLAPGATQGGGGSISSLAKKLQIPQGQTVRLVNPPERFELDAPTSARRGDAILVFVRNGSDLAKHKGVVVEGARTDRLTWIAYPKAGQLDTDLSRDVLWKLLEGAGIRPVRQVALDETWSALRFRPA